MITLWLQNTAFSSLNLEVLAGILGIELSFSIVNNKGQTGLQDEVSTLLNYG